MTDLEQTVRPRPVVSVVIVNWNGERLLDECLTALAAQTLRDEMEVVVVDNGSIDDSLAVLERHASLARVIANTTNVGFAAGCNQGIRATSAEFVALLNNDAIAEPDWLAQLVAAMRREPRLGSATSKVLAYDDRALFDNAGHVLYADGLTRGRGRLERDRGQYEREEEVFCISGCAALLRRSMLDDVGLLDETFFAYCEDADLGFRARLRGWRCHYVPSAVVYHKFSASTDAFSPLKALNVERNRLWLALKNLPLPWLLLSPGFTLLRYGWQAYGALRGRGASGRFAEQASRGALARILVSAYGQAARGVPRALAQRRAIQAGRTVPLREVWAWRRRFGIDARRIALME
jgi:GT2 family glycosyltransferase